MNVYSASVALLWTTAMRATTPTSRPPRAARDAASLHLLRSTRGAVAPLADGSMDEAPRFSRHRGDSDSGRSRVDFRR